MNVIVASTFTPGVGGTDETAAERLARELERHGHTVSEVRVPAGSGSERLTETATAIRLWRLDPWGDLLIAVGFPSVLSQHPRKVAWFVDADSRPDPAGCDPAVARFARTAEQRAITECVRVYAGSPGLAAQLADTHSRAFPVLGIPRDAAAWRDAAAELAS
ncbi:MAG: hypothetical protein KDC33_02590 [Thermoleophilia bacterium]|nr:hypothetical protein [Thermoleophilia bacterium]